MSERTAKRLRKEAKERGDTPHVPVYNKPLTFPIKNSKGEPEDTYIPRRTRRKIMRAFLTDYRKGRLKKEDL